MTTTSGTGRKLLASKVGITRTRDSGAAPKKTTTLAPKQAQHGKPGSRLV
jgi:hypothetical protein